MNYTKTQKHSILKANLASVAVLTLVFIPFKVGALYTPTYTSSGSSYSPSYVSSGSSYSPSYVSSGSSYTPSYISSGSSYTPSYTSSGSSYTPSYVSSGSSYTPSYISSGSSYTPSYTSEGSSYIPSYISSGSSYIPTYESSDSSYFPSYISEGSSYIPTYISSGSSYIPTYTSDQSSYDPTLNYTTPSSPYTDFGNGNNGSGYNYPPQTPNGGYFDAPDGTLAYHNNDPYQYPYPNNNNNCPQNDCYPQNNQNNCPQNDCYPQDDYPYDDCPQDNCYDDDCEYYDNCYEEEPLSVVCVANNSSSVERYDSVTFTARAIGGSGHYTYSWSGDVSGSGRSISRTFNTSGRKTAEVTVRSSGRVDRAICTVNVRAAENLEATCDASPNEVEEGEEVVWRVNATGGDGHYTYSWSEDVSGNNRIERESYSNSGRKTGRVRVTSDGQSITRVCSVRVIEDRRDNNNLRAVCEVSPDNPDIGDTVTWKVRVSGGDGDYEYRWTGDVSGNGRTESKRYNSAGRKEATVRVTSDGETIRKTCSVHIDDDRNINRNTNVTPPSNITLVQTQTPPPSALSSGVFLSDLPYTGVKENVKFILFFLGLVLWSALIAYILFKRNAEKKSGKKMSHKELIEKFKAENLARKSAI